MKTKNISRVAAKEGSLFLICPDCQLEQQIRDTFGDNCYFLTALGAVFEAYDFAFAEELNQFIIAQQIRHIFIVNDTACTFVQNAICREHNYHTRAEAILKLLLRKNCALREMEGTVGEKAEELVRLNIARQSADLLDAAFIGNKIQAHDLELHGLVFDRGSRQFSEIALAV